MLTATKGYFKQFQLFAAVCTVLASIVAIPAHAAEPTAAEYGTILNLSGRQRMLTQKMSKEVLLVALDVDKAANVDNLKSTSALFDKTLTGLKDGDASVGLPATSSKRILRQLTKVEELWAGFYPTIQAITSNGSVSAEQVAEIAAKNLPLLKQMNKTVGAYEKAAAKGGLSTDPGLAATINLAGKQRMLTQKMSKEFLLIAYGQDAEANRLSLLETLTLFDRTLVGLFSGDATLGLPGNPSAGVKAQLDVVQGLWNSFKPVVEAGSATGSSIAAGQISQLASSNLPLLREMNKAVGMYEKESS